MDKHALMTESKVETLICRMAVPTMTTMMISALYNMADTFFVGKIGTSATGAVGISFSVMAIIQATGFFFGHGSGNYMSRKLGEQKTEEANSMASIGFFSSFIFGIFVTILGLIFLKELVYFLGSTETIAPYAKDYLFYILLAAPFMASSLTINNQLRFQGSATYGMLGMTSGAVLNIILDPILIFKFNLGVSGAAIATMISQFVAFVILIFMSRRKGNIAPRFRNFKPSLAYYKNIITGGIPSLIRQSIASVATILLNKAAYPFGDAAIAAMSIVTRIMLIANSALLGFGQGFQPVCGFNYGAKMYERVKRGFWFCVKVSTVALTLFSVVDFIFAPQLIKIFRDDAEVIKIGTTALHYQAITLPILGFITLSSMMLQTIGVSKQASILAMARQGLFFMPAILILPSFFGLLGIQISQPVADFFTFILSIPLCLSVLKAMK